MNLNSTPNVVEKSSSLFVLSQNSYLLFVFKYKVEWLYSNFDLEAKYDGSVDVTATCPNLLYF